LRARAKWLRNSSKPLLPSGGPSMDDVTEYV
jgi:hypothetical protein